MSPFDLFPTSSYTFLELSQEVEGMVIKSEHPAEGIVKVRSGMRQTGYGDIEGGAHVDNAPTVHIKPDEPFLSLVDDLVGHGIRIASKDYRITGSVPGIDYDVNSVVFHKVTLKKEAIASWDESDSPLS